MLNRKGSGVVGCTVDDEGERCVDTLPGTYCSCECRICAHAIPGTILSLTAIRSEEVTGQFYPCQVLCEHEICCFDTNL